MGPAPEIDAEASGSAYLGGSFDIGEGDYHVDWLKGNVDRWAGWTEKDAAYWTVLGADQLVHQLTYLAIIAYLSGAVPH